LRGVVAYRQKKVITLGTPIALLFLGALAFATLPLVSLVLAALVLPVLAAFRFLGIALSISEDELRMRRPFRAPIVITKGNIGACAYRRYESHGRGFELCFLEIRNAAGDEMHIPRFGWTRNKRRAVFAHLSAWIAGSSITPEHRTRQFLDRAAL
jgi:hypothetical protein